MITLRVFGLHAGHGTVRSPALFPSSAAPMLGLAPLPQLGTSLPQRGPSVPQLALPFLGSIARAPVPRLVARPPVPRLRCPRPRSSAWLPAPAPRLRCPRSRSSARLPALPFLKSVARAPVPPLHCPRCRSSAPLPALPFLGWTACKL